MTDVVEAGPRHLFDVGKARRIRDALISERLLQADDFVAPAPLTDAELLIVHTPEHVQRIHQPQTLARLLLLDPARPWSDQLLQPFLAASGGTVAAARLAARERLIAVNLGGGFHHAQADKAEGFCAIADVAIAIRLLKRQGLARRVLIVDLDYHHGNGNAEIFQQDESVFTFSVHAGNWCWITKRNNLDVELPARTGDAAYLAALRGHLPAITDTFRPDLAIYLAGSDPYQGDLLGDFNLSEAGMLERDQLVTRAIWGRAIPMAIVLAGGYGAESWRIHLNYFRWLLTAGDE